MPANIALLREWSNRKLNWALAILLLIAAAEFVFRGPVRFVQAQSVNDFMSPYIQTRAWMHGTDPYSPNSLVMLWPKDTQKPEFLTKDLLNGSLVLKHGIPTAYPPTAFVLLAPIASLSWHVAHRVWLILMVLAFAVTFLALGSLAGFQPREKRTYLLLALAFAFAPFHTGMATGSIVIVVLGLCSSAMLAEDRGHNVGAGILIAVAVSLKPQIGLPFLAYYLLRRLWRLALTSLGLLLLLAVIAISLLRLNHSPWLQDYRYDNQVLFAPGSLGDFTQANPIRFGLVNLQVALSTFAIDRTTANVTSLLIVFMLGIVWLLLLRRSTNPDNDKLLFISALVTISLLPVYHRLYDACLLVIPLTWTLAISRKYQNGIRSFGLFLLLIFLIPGGSVLEELQRSGHAFALQHSWVWVHVVMPHQVWAILLLGVCLLREIQQRSRRLENSTVPVSLQPVATHGY